MDEREVGRRTPPRHEGRGSPAPDRATRGSATGRHPAPAGLIEFVSRRALPDGWTSSRGGEIGSGPGSRDEPPCLTPRPSGATPAPTLARDPTSRTLATRPRVNPNLPRVMYSRSRGARVNRLEVPPARGVPVSRRPQLPVPPPTGTLGPPEPRSLVRRVRPARPTGEPCLPPHRDRRAGVGERGSPCAAATKWARERGGFPCAPPLGSLSELGRGR